MSAGEDRVIVFVRLTEDRVGLIASGRKGDLIRLPQHWAEHLIETGEAVEVSDPRFTVQQPKLF